MGIFTPYEVAGISTGPDGRRYPYGACPEDFDPQYVCLVYLKWEQAGVVAKHAYFDMPADLRRFAMDEFWAVERNGTWVTAPIRDEVNFEGFTFGSQHLIVFFTDPDGAPMRFDKDNLVQFAEWSARGVKTPATRRALNNCFLNPDVKDWFERDVLVLENWFVDEQGAPIKSRLELHYAMNVHLLAKCVLPGSAGGLFDVPLVLDPDTGNGMGYEP